jgi:hypothetical protein
MKLYFVYGSNLWLEQLRDCCPDHRKIGMGLVEGYPWIIWTRGYVNVINQIMIKFTE